jgi:hypothetical protein
MYLTAYYLIYAATCGLLMTGLVVDLHWTARLFLRDAAREKHESMKSIARLLAAGFYMVSIGYVAMTMHTFEALPSAGYVVEYIGLKAGFLLVLLGILHIVNISILAILRRRSEAAPPAAVL